MKHDVTRALIASYARTSYPITRAGNCEYMTSVVKSKVDLATRDRNWKWGKPSFCPSPRTLLHFNPQFTSTPPAPRPTPPLPALSRRSCAEQIQTNFDELLIGIPTLIKRVTVEIKFRWQRAICRCPSGLILLHRRAERGKWTEEGEFVTDERG